MQVCPLVAVAVDDGKRRMSAGAGADCVMLKIRVAKMVKVINRICSAIKIWNPIAIFLVLVVVSTGVVFIFYVKLKIDNRFAQVQLKIDDRYAQMQLKIDSKFDQMQLKIDSRFDQMQLKIDSRFDQVQFETTDVPPPYGALAAGIFAKEKNINCTKFSKNRSAVMIVAGQSNAGNNVETKGSNHHGENIANYYAGECKIASDPLMGADGDRGSPWIRLANELIENGNFDRILIVPVSLGGTSMARWRKGGDLRLMLQSQIKRLNLEGIPVTHTLWVQGEADRFEHSRYGLNGGTVYHDELLSLAETITRNTTGNFYITLTSSCTASSSASPAIRWAQKEAILSLNNGRVLEGPDLDKINAKGDRYDACHLSDKGVKKFVSEWVKIFAPK